MEMVLNELSLNGQFDSIQSFFDSLPSMIKMQKIVESANATLLRHHELYTRPVTSQHQLRQILTDSSTRTSNEIRTFKRLLNKLMSDQPFWTDMPKHSSSNVYACEYDPRTHGYSLAEACERDRVILSFEHKDFQNDSIEVIKNGYPIVLINMTNHVGLSKHFWETELITDPSLYCKYRFDGSKLSFDFLEDEFSFNGLEYEEVKAFLSTFEQFTELTWDNIFISDGLQYKSYSPSSKKRDWFRNSPHHKKRIYKFRTSQKYRCFGYREDDVFFVIRFERDHDNSDHG